MAVQMQYSVLFLPKLLPFLFFSIFADVMGKMVKDAKTSPEQREECEKIARMADTYRSATIKADYHRPNPSRPLPPQL